MSNPGQPTIGLGATGDPVRRAQRALRRTPDLGLAVDGIFGPATEAAVKEFQKGLGLTVDGIVGDVRGPDPITARNEASRIRNDLLTLRNGFVRENASTLLDAINMNEIRGPVMTPQIH